MHAKFAMITPWPPQHTGIADYAYDLAAGLIEEGNELTVITEAEEPKALAGVTFKSPDWLNDETAGGFDQLIFQLGNSRMFHIFQLPLLFRYSGVVHLHDMVLHHLMAWLLYVKGSTRLYRTVLAKWYGPICAEWAWKSLTRGRGVWDKPYVTQIPFFEEIVQHSRSVITHSQFAAARVAKAFPQKPIHVVPQLYREVLPRSSRYEDTFKIGIFGGVDPNKRLDVVIDAVTRATMAGCSIELHIAGKIHESCRTQIEQLRTANQGGLTVVHDRVEHAVFLSLISSVDLCLALRYPTMGETSAVVMRALQAGTPVIVNNIGWYAELPDFLPKLEPGSTEESEKLAQLLIKYADKGAEYRALLEETGKYAKTELQFKKNCKLYADIVLMDAKVSQ